MSAPSFFSMEEIPLCITNLSGASSSSHHFHLGDVLRELKCVCSFLCERSGDAGLGKVCMAARKEAGKREWMAWLLLCQYLSNNLLIHDLLLG